MQQAAHDLRDATAVSRFAGRRSRHAGWLDTGRLGARWFARRDLRASRRLTERASASMPGGYPKRMAVVRGQQGEIHMNQMVILPRGLSVVVRRRSARTDPSSDAI
jgi:hypothetical protein